MKPRLHLAALPHVRPGSPTAHLCAYSTKIRLFCKAMQEKFDIFLYCPEGAEIPGVQIVDCLSESKRIETFGPDDPNRLPAWPTDAQTREFNEAAIQAIQKLAEPRDLVLLSGGLTHLAIKNALPGMLFCEPFVGYEGVIGGNSHAAYESHSHMSRVYAQRGWNDIRWFDRVIPPFVDADEFPRINDGNGQYLLFVGRLIPRKGPHVALQIAQSARMPLYIAGAGGRMEGGVLFGAEGVRLEGDVTYLGPVGIEERAKLMAGARALIVPTIYQEPGGNVAIEAMMAGTPVIAPDFGVFAETVRPYLTGFHFRTLRQAFDAYLNLPILDPKIVRQQAIENYSLQAIAPKYETWFSELQTLWDKGWDTL